MKKLVILVMMIWAGEVWAQDHKEIQWLSFEEAVELNKKEPRKILVDIYTHWCGWCKRMDKDTYENPEVIEYINSHFYPVKLNAEMRDTVQFNGVTFVNSGQGRKPAHQLAISLLNGKMSYPNTVFLDENFQLLTRAPGYLSPQRLMPILHYFGDNNYLEMKFPEFQAKYNAQGQ